MQHSTNDGASDAPRILDAASASTAVETGSRRYFADRRTRVDAFVDAHFSLRGTLALHRAAVGWDILRAPLNLSLSVPQIAMQLASRAAGKAGAKRAAAALRRPILLRTAVARDLDWLVHVDLLELPFSQNGRESRRDAWAEAILASPEVQAALQTAGDAIERQGGSPEFHSRLADAMAEYGVSRAAAAEITTGLLSLSAGALALNKLTPGAASLGPALAGVMAQQAAVAGFPLGGWLGGLWFGMFPAAPSAGLVAGATGGLILAATTFAAFAGVVSDPIQRALGLHRARLLRMIDRLEAQVSDPSAPGFAVHDHYVARLLDLFDILSAALRLAHP